MHRNQANRARIAERAGTLGNTGRNVGTPGMDPAARITVRGTIAAGPVRRTRAVPMTGAQRNSLGKRSEWNAPMDFFTDPAWDRTVTSHG